MKNIFLRWKYIFMIMMIIKKSFDMKIYLMRKVYPWSSYLYRNKKNPSLALLLVWEWEKSFLVFPTCWRILLFCHFNLHNSLSHFCNTTAMNSMQLRKNNDTVYFSCKLYTWILCRYLYIINKLILLILKWKRILP